MAIQETSWQWSDALCRNLVDRATRVVLRNTRLSQRPIAFQTLGEAGEFVSKKLPLHNFTMPHLYNMDEATAFTHVTCGTAKRLRDEGYIAYPDSEEEPLEVQQQPREQSNYRARSQLIERETEMSPKTTPEAQYLQEENRQLKAENARLKLLWENAQLRAENARLRQSLVDQTLKASIAASSTIERDYDLLSEPISDLQGFDTIPASRADSQTAEQDTLSDTKFDSASASLAEWLPQ
ncbi:uncharacterized protein J3D65DRAFT_669912 [Phyllosticta citribraziliensis]|uniref:Uncharacterized protein n=1 Tax=Phyllosticta citribraziliensis TaxID=989973 RepID=A0ABR1LG98_9PEZI